MGRLDTIKAKLASLLVEVAMSVLKTDNGIFVYDGEEIAVDTALFVEDEEGNRTPAEDGTYTLEDERKIVVEGGKIVEIIEKAEETEEPTEETPEEEVAAEEIVETPEEEEVAPEGGEPKEEDNIAELKERVEVLEATVAELTSAIETLKTETLSKLSMSAAKPATVEFEQLSAVPKKTGDSKVDRFLERYGNK